MTTIEKQILERIRRLDASTQERVLAFLDDIEAERYLTAQELMKLPPEERQKRVQAAFALAANEDFEIFEAYSEEPLDDK